MVEQLIYTEKVTGSSPVSPTNKEKVPIYGDFFFCSVLERIQGEKDRANTEPVGEVTSRGRKNLRATARKLFVTESYLLFPNKFKSFKKRFTKSRYKVRAPIIDSL